MYSFNIFLLSFFYYFVVAKGLNSTTVKTANGPIVGHVASNRSRVVEYLGIPYAEPPVGVLRFAAPQKYTAKGEIVASKFVSQNHQNILQLMSNLNVL